MEKTDARDSRANVLHRARRTSVSSARAWRVARPRQSSLRPARILTSARWRSSLAGQQIDTAFDNGVKKFTLVDDSLHAGDGADGFPHQRLDQAQLERGVFLLDGGRRRAHAGNAADDCLGLPLERRAGDVEEEGHRQETQLDSELRRDGRAVHRQDRHAHH